MQNLIESLESDVLSLSLWCHWIWLQTTSWMHRTTWSRTIGVCEGNMFFNLQEIRSYQSCTIAVLTRISTDACHIEEWLMCEEMQKLWPNYNLGTCSVMTLAFYIALLALMSVACSQHVSGIAGASHAGKKDAEILASLPQVSVDGAIGLVSAAENISSGIQKPTGPD